MKIVAAYESLIALIHLQHNTVFFFLQTRINNKTAKQRDKGVSGRMSKLFLSSIFQSFKNSVIFYTFLFFNKIVFIFHKDMLVGYGELP